MRVGVRWVRGSAGGAGPCARKLYMSAGAKLFTVMKKPDEKPLAAFSSKIKQIQCSNIKVL